MSRYTGFSVELAGALEAAQSLSTVPAKILLAQKRAIGTMQRRLATEAKRDIGGEYNLPASRIAEGLVVRQGVDGVRLIGRKRGINAIEFGAQWTRVRGDGMAATVSKRRFRVAPLKGKLRGDNGLGARFAIKRGKAPEVHAGSFIARGRNGARLVFERTTAKRLPLEGVYGPSVGQMLKHGRRPERLAEFAIRILQSEQARLLGSNAR